MSKKIILIALIASCFSSPIWASGSNAHLDHVEVSLKDTASLQNGAKYFVNYCLSCHSAKYLRYNRMSDDLHIPKELVMANMVVPGQNFGDAMTITMKAGDAKKWFGVAPPDLSLIGKLRDKDWLYNYLRSFYRDTNTATGWNNTVFPHVAMPHVMADLQGTQQAIFKTVKDHNGKSKLQFDKFELISEGSLTPQEFDAAMKDLTGFLYYMAEPNRASRINYGIWVMLFLGVLGTLTYLLKKEYWKDIH